MFPVRYLGPVEMLYERLVCAYHFRIFATFHWFDQYATGVNFDHDHDVLISSTRACWKLSRLVSEYCLPHVVYFCVDVSHLFTL